MGRSSSGKDDGRTPSNRAQRLGGDGEPSHSDANRVETVKCCAACRQVVVRFEAHGWCRACYKRWYKCPEPRPDVPPERKLRPAGGNKKRDRLPCRVCGKPRLPQSASEMCRPCWLRRDAVTVERVVMYGIEFRRYPNSSNAAHRRYFRPGTSDVERGIDALHREVYRREVGPIPPGYEIHHLDSDTGNNTPSNLVALTRAEHRALTVTAWKVRGGSWRDRGAMLAHLETIRPLAAEARRNLRNIQPDNQ